MANTLINTALIAKEALYQLRNSLGFIGKIRRTYESEFARKGNKVGDSINVRLPVQHTVNTGQALNLEDIKEESVAIRVDTQNHVDFSFPSADLALEIDQFSQRYLKTAAVKLANHISMTALSKFTKKVAQHVGVPGTTPSSLLTPLQAKAKLDLVAVPTDNRYCLVDPTTQVTLVNAMSTFLLPTQQISRQTSRGEMGEIGGLSYFMDQTVYTHGLGTVAATSTPLTNGTTADGATSFVTDGWASGTCTINEGDVISIAGLYEVNPLTKVSTGQLKQFVCTRTISNAATTVNITIPVSPTVILTGPRQNCYYNGSTVADGQAVYWFDKTGNTDLTAISAKSSPQSLVFHPDFATLVFVDLPLFPNEDMARASDPDLGLSLRVWTQPDISTDSCPTRIDILWGGDVLRAEMACRMSA